MKDEVSATLLIREKNIGLDPNQKAFYLLHLV
jgi:hypothetical protein